MKRTALFLGNWKMQMNCADTAQFISNFSQLIELNSQQPDIGIAAPFTSLAALAKATAATPGILVGAQNAHWLDHGAHTGEISIGMLQEHNVQFVLCGHSERRQFYGETDQTVALRANAVMRRGLTAVVCCGESESQFTAKQTKDVLRYQLQESLKAIEVEQLDKLVVAYEPIWAIGTGLTASPEIAQDVHSYIRKQLVELFGETAQGVQLLYGGSVKPDNIAALVACENIDGALVGGASLVPETFASLIKAGRQAQD